MAESSGRLRLALEAQLKLGVLRQLRDDHLNGDGSHSPKMGGLKDCTHRAFTE